VLVAVWPDVLIVIVEADGKPFGTVTFKLVLVAEIIVAIVLLNLTSLLAMFGLKFFPEIE